MLQIKWVIQMATPERQKFEGEWVSGRMRLQKHLLQVQSWNDTMYVHFAGLPRTLGAALIDMVFIHSTLELK